MRPVGVRVDRKGGELVAFPVVFVQIAAHDQRIERHEGKPLAGLPVVIRRGSQLGGDLVAGRVGHLLHPHRHGHVHRPGGHRHHRAAESRRPRPAGRFDVQRLGVAQPHPVRDVRAQMLLVVGGTGHHVAHEEALRADQPGIMQSRQHRLAGQLAQRFVPLLVDFGLSDPQHGNFTHDQGSL